MYTDRIWDLMERSGELASMQCRCIREAENMEKYCMDLKEYAIYVYLSSAAY